MILGSPNPQPRGVPLDVLQQWLASSSLKTSRDGDALIVKHERLVSRIDVMPPKNQEADADKISAVVAIRTVLPGELASLIGKPAAVAAANTMATLRALYIDGDGVYVGSRLTVYEQEDAWNLQLPLLLFSTIVGVDTVLRGAGRSPSKEIPKAKSQWTEADLDFIRSYLSKFCVCSGGRLAITAEFGLKAGEFAVVAGHRNTALWQISAEQPHPEMGGGLFCLLQLPYRFSDDKQLDRIINELNKMEMQPHDLPPHFGAWCRGSLQNNAAYVSFVPNALHSVSGIGVNFSIWARTRAHWADAMLMSMGVV